MVPGSGIWRRGQGDPGYLRGGGEGVRRAGVHRGRVPPRLGRPRGVDVEGVMGPRVCRRDRHARLEGMGRTGRSSSTGVAGGGEKTFGPRSRACGTVPIRDVGSFQRLVSAVRSSGSPGRLRRAVRNRKIRPEKLDEKSLRKQLLGWCLTYPFNMLGTTPAASIPCGFTANGFPVGLQIVGHPYAAAVLRASANFEQVRPWAARRPNLHGTMSG